jgi:hypothetical protein
LKIVHQSVPEASTAFRLPSDSRSIIRVRAMQDFGFMRWHCGRLGCPQELHAESINALHPSERRAQIPGIMQSLPRSWKKAG